MATPRLKELYKSEIVSKLESELAIDNINKVPRLEKIVVNMGVGEAASDSKQLDAAMNDMRIITGQQPCVTRAKKSIASFKLREGMPIGARVTLRKDRMWDFLDKLMNFALPRVRDFRGIPDRGFDGRGNFTLGIKEHTIFPEMEADRVENPKGMNITIVTSATTDKEGKFLLDQLGMPFRK